MFEHKRFLQSVTNGPGIYQMINSNGEVLYVGKARNLKKRITSYFRSQQSIKTTALVNQIQKIEVIVTVTETEALLLESNLIKKLKPRYNVVFRDDKSYPYIFISVHADFPRLSFYRGSRKEPGRYFGPYPSAATVRETLNLLQKLFLIRSCEDSFFRSRTRPCLQYQIKRCTAPCVGYIDSSNYQRNVQHAMLFLEGKSQTVIDDLVQQMEVAATQLEYEKAAHYRDLIAMLRKIRQQQVVTTDKGDVDVIAMVTNRGKICIQVLAIRTGKLLGSKAYFPKAAEVNESEEIMAAFLTQYYLSDQERKIPHHIITNQPILDEEWILNTFAEQAGYKVTLTHNPRGERARWLDIAVQNAQQTLTSHLAERATIFQQLETIQQLLKLESLPQRLECFDVSHTFGEATVASCVVFDEQGPRKSDYRRFNIHEITPGDDYGALRQALLRRYTSLKTHEEKLPDVLIIDGGKGQLKQAEEVLEEIQVSGVAILAIAKGPTRKAGLETLFLSGKEHPLAVTADSLALHFIQHLRDEAHRFAITGHRGQRAKKRRVSLLEEIPGIGAKRRRELLKQFGGLQELKRASIEDIAKVPGISKELAEKIYIALQGI